jgi:hypothetical protein
MKKSAIGVAIFLLSLFFLAANLVFSSPLHAQSPFYQSGRRLATVILAANIFGRPLVIPAGVPAERLKILREAWNRTVKDAELLAEAKKRGWPVEPVAGEELEALAKEVIAQPPEVVQRLKKLLGE